MASPKVEQILRGIQDLSEAEADELSFFLSGRTESGWVISQESLVESFHKSHSVHMGPVNRDTCAWCGK